MELNFRDCCRNIAGLAALLASVVTRLAKRSTSRKTHKKQRVQGVPAAF
jgi:hypothetical protein